LLPLKEEPMAKPPKASASSADAASTSASMPGTLGPALHDLVNVLRSELALDERQARLIARAVVRASDEHSTAARHT
jgi:hypothetical protein